MYELALRHGGDPVIIREIALNQGISEKYLSKLVIPLKGAQLVSSARGAHGGYVLTRDPSAITIRQIVEVLEGDITPVECVKNGSVCERSGSCPARDIWCGLDRTIAAYLEGITLDDLVRSGYEDAGASGYCI